MMLTNILWASLLRAGAILSWWVTMTLYPQLSWLSSFQSEFRTSNVRWFDLLLHFLSHVELLHFFHIFLLLLDGSLMILQIGGVDKIISRLELEISRQNFGIYRVSSKTVCTSILLFSRVPEYIQKNFWPFFNSPGDEDFKTHLTFLPTWKIDLVTEQNVRQTGFWEYHFNGRFCIFFEGVANFKVNYLSHF